MKKLLLLMVLLAVAAIPSFAQTDSALLITLPGYMVAYFSNNTGPGGAADQQIRLVNYGRVGDPLDSPTIGDVCANTYVFDANQEMVACCSCRITPNGLRTISVANDLTNNPLTSVVPVNGAIKIVSTGVLDGFACDPVKSIVPVPSLVGFSTGLQTSGGTGQGTFITETRITPVALSLDEGLFLVHACNFARYLGSNKGVCTCGTGS